MSTKVNPSAHTEGTPELRKSRNISADLTQVFNVSDPELMGARPDPATQTKLDAIRNREPVPGISNAHLLETERERFMQVTKDFPKHFIKILPICVLPILVGCIPLVIMGVKHRILKDQYPHYVGTAADMSDAAIYHFSAGFLAFTCIERILVIGGYYMGTIAVMIVLFNPKRLFKPLLLYTILPPYILHVVIACLYRFEIKWNQGCSSFAGIMFLVQTLCVLLAFVSGAYVTERYTKQPRWGTLYSIMTITTIVIILMYNYFVWPAIITGSDATKFLVGAILNPIIFELIITYGRAIVRTVSHAHESTLTAPICVVVAFKKMLGRFIIGLIQSWQLVLAASIFLGIAEILSVCTLAVRDRFLYRMCCGRSALKRGVDPYAAIKDKWLLRARNAHLESVLEFCFTLTSGFTIFLIFDISVDGHNSPAVGALLANVLIQLSTEVVVDYVQCAWLTVKSKTPIMAVAHLNYRGWTAFLCTIMYVSCVFMTDNILITLIGNVGDHEAAFVLYDVDRFVNETGNLSCPEGDGRFE